MRVLLSTYGSRGDVEPIVALAVQSQALGAQVRMCAPPDEEFRELLAREGAPLVPFDRPWRSWERPPTADERHQRVADSIAAQKHRLRHRASRLLTRRLLRRPLDLACAPRARGLQVR
jgi:vancomycin aglycone glucosyltransferase